MLAPVQHSERHGFGQMPRGNAGGIVQIGNGPGHAQHSGACPRGKGKTVDRSLHQGMAFGIQRAMLIEQRAGKFRVAARASAAITRPLRCPGLEHAFAHLCRRSAAARAAKIAELNKTAQSFINAAAGADLVPDFEFATWPLQSAEAQAWAADKSAPTPILDGIAAARGMDADKLKAAALRKALAYSALSAHVAGQRQALQSKIEAAKTKDELDKIKIEFTAPTEAA